MKRQFFLVATILLIAAACDKNTTLQSQKRSSDQGAVSQANPAQNKVQNITCQNYKNFGIGFSCPQNFYIQQFESSSPIYKNLIGLSFIDKNHPVDYEGDRTPYKYLCIFTLILIMLRLISI